MPKIPAKVAAILTDSTVALNVGSNHGVAVDDKATVLRPVDIEDPDTHEKLGQVGVVVVNLRVSYVQEKLCTAHVSSYQDDPAGNSATRVRKYKKIVEDLFGEKAGFNVFIQIGDPVTVDIAESLKFSDEPPF